MPMCGWSILERPPFFLMGRHWITGSPGKKATGRMGTCWDWTIWLTSWKASLKDELRKNGTKLAGLLWTVCSIGITQLEGNLYSLQTPEVISAEGAASRTQQLVIKMTLHRPSVNLNNSRLVCIAPAWLQTGPQRVKISILRNHTSMSQEVCMVNQTILTSGKQMGLQIYLLVKQSKYLGIQGRNNSFSENYVVLKPARVLFFFFLPLNSKSPCSCVHYGLDQQLLCCVTVCAEGGNGWTSQETWSKGRQQFVVAGCGNCCWPFLLFPTHPWIRFYPRTAFAFYVASQEITDTLRRE